MYTVVDRLGKTPEEQNYGEYPRIELANLAIAAGQLERYEIWRNGELIAVGAPLAYVAADPPSTAATPATSSPDRPMDPPLTAIAVSIALVCLTLGSSMVVSYGAPGLLLAAGLIPAAILPFRAAANRRAPARVAAKATDRP